MYLETKKEGSVYYVTMNRPDLHNAFNEEMIEEFISCFRKIDADSDIRLVVLEGKGKSFCAGADLNWMKKMKDYSEQENRADSQQLACMYESINNCVKPVVAFVHGAAIGGGAGLVSVCDYVLCQEKTKFGFTEVRLGLLPAVISPYVMAKIKESYARAYFLSGMLFSEKEAYHMGLIHDICQASDWEEKKVKVVHSFLKAAPEAAAQAKTLVKKNIQIKSIEELKEYTINTIAQKRIGQEAQAGMKALLEKSKAPWVLE